ncbi:MAG: alpha/beta fold hydrolase [Alphaproteobacteria bacterium]|nr:alpha/beta fold hydrolase [Alphaproteobacteria bacterium]
MHLFEMWMDEGAHVSSEILSFAAEAYKIDQGLKPVWSTPNTVTLELTTMHLRDFSASHAEGLPVIIDAPHAGHSATIADFSPRQSLVRTLKKHGLERLYVTDWKSASAEMKFLSIDSYLEEMNVVIDDLGGQAHLIGLCQGGWMSAAYAARFPGKVRTLTLAGSPIDTAVGDGKVKELAQTLPLHFYEDLVTAGGGRLLGKFMLAGWKSMHPTDQYLNKYVDLYTHIEDKAYVQRAEEFARWYESPVDLPGTYYLQAVQWIFKENRLALGNFVALGRALSLKDITIPVYLLAGEEDDITPPPQVLNADRYLGTPAQALQKKLVPGGHIGLFMAHKTLETAWPEIAQWIRAQERAEQP